MGEAGWFGGAPGEFADSVLARVMGMEERVAALERVIAEPLLKRMENPIWLKPTGQVVGGPCGTCRWRRSELTLVDWCAKASPTGTRVSCATFGGGCWGWEAQP
jgi:hypothetical protein